VNRALTAADLDAYAEEYYLDLAGTDLFIEEILQHDVIDLLSRSVSPEARVLEMGFGTGVAALDLLERGYDIEVVEGSPLLCQSARVASSSLTVHESLFEQFVPSIDYDVVLCLFILEHVDDPGEVVRKAIRWLKPGGSLVIAVPNCESIHREVAVSIGLQESLDVLSERDLLVGHQRVFSPKQLTSLIEESGLVDIKLEGSFLKVVPNSLMTVWDPSLIRALCEASRGLPAEKAANLVATARTPL
jgi:2-polyprenyl-3-methyl-5-hydroxy-6-metoxy-1,4-benzoquinol methylase